MFNETTASLSALGDAKTPKFHIDDYIQLYKDPFIRQMAGFAYGGP